MATGKGGSKEFDKFFQAVEELKKAGQSSQHNEMTRLEGKLGTATLSLIEEFTKHGQQEYLRKLESDFGRAARALIEGVGGDTTVRKKLESDFETAAVALMGFSGGQQAPGLDRVKSDFAKASRKLLLTSAKLGTAEAEDIADDFVKAARALRECNLDLA